MLKFILITLAIKHVLCQRTLQVTDYCSTDKCVLESYKHITCDLPTIQANPNCASVMEFTDEAKKIILDGHNQVRNKIAGGKQPGFKPSNKMTTMEWDDELADYALLNVMRCKVGHDCHNTDNFQHAGQNIYVSYDDEITKNAKDAPRAWYAEVNFSDQSNVDQCCDLNVGHFTQVVRDRANKIGCAAGKINDQGSDKTYVVCNYSYGNLGGKAYISGKPASNCETGNNPQYPALCSSAEQIDPNDTN